MATSTVFCGAKDDLRQLMYPDQSSLFPTTSMQMVTSSEVSTPDKKVHGFLCRNGTFTIIDYPGAVRTVTQGINARGDMVGPYTDAANKQHGFLLRADR
jgi:ribosomal protein L34